MNLTVMLQTVNEVTILAALISGFVLGLVLLRVDPFVDTFTCLVHAALPGTVFLGMIMAARWSAGTVKWELYLGLLLLWALYIAAAMVLVVLWRRWKSR